MHHHSCCLGHSDSLCLFQAYGNGRHVFCPVFQVFFFFLFEATEAPAISCKQNSGCLNGVGERACPLPLCYREYACQHAVGIVCVSSMRKKQDEPLGSLAHSSHLNLLVVIVSWLHHRKKES